VTSAAPRFILGAVEVVEKVMRRVLLSLSAAIGGCSPSPQEPAAMHRAQPLSVDSQMTKPVSNETGKPEAAAQGPVVEAVSAAENSLQPVPSADSPAMAVGRRTLSTAFVMIGPDRHLTVGLHDGSTMVLRDVVMRKKDYCGVRVLGTAVVSKYCGDYADVATARPGGGPSAGTGDALASDATGMEAKPLEPR
jgi:hypothetical protein